MSSLSVVTPKITILENTINIVDGLYSLNDMHKAGGGAKKHQPAFFIRNKEVEELVEEIKQSANLQSDKVLKKINGGKKRGTYVCKELVYRYAMWVSPKFALIVIRAFDTMVTSQVASPLNPDQTLPLRNAVNLLVTKAGIMYPDAYKMVHHRFKVNHIKDMTPSQVDEAVEYVHSLILKVNQPIETEEGVTNEMWRYVGMLKQQEISNSLREAENLLRQLQMNLKRSQNNNAYIYDAFAEQRRIANLGESAHKLAFDKAERFIDRQEQRNLIAR